MSEYADAKRHFYLDAVVHGIRDIGDLNRVYPLGCAVPQKYLARWLRRMQGCKAPDKIPEQPRLLNHFKLGADPEFVFANADGQRVDASALGLKTGLAFGADMNGRLVEIRPKAYRFALKTVGSAMEELRWLALLYPETRRLRWRAGAFQFHDGLGGHVHLGRKRPTRSAEVNALDVLTQMMLKLRCYPEQENLRRQNGDQHGQQYGKWGDIRLQIHGYEYRSFPSWLDSPWLAYLTLVLSKLTVYDPELMCTTKPELQRQRIYNLLGYYKGRDDDAWIAFTALQKLGLPQHNGGDFRPRWGLMYDVKDPRPDVQVVPGSIAPSADTMKDLFEFFVNGTPIPQRTPTPTWEPTKVPSGFFMPLDRMDTARQKSIGEILWDAACSEKYEIGIYPSDGAAMFQVGHRLAKDMPSDWQKQLKAIAPDAAFGVDTGHATRIGIGRFWREDVKRAALARKALLSGVFPVWRLKDVTPDCLEDWKQQKNKKVERTFDAKVLFEKEIN